MFDVVSFLKLFRRIYLDLVMFMQQMVNGFSLGSMYALIAIGYTMVYGVLRLINFAHGDIMRVGIVTGKQIGRAHV